MLDLANDIRSLSDFKRNTVELLDRLRETEHPLVLTVDGRAELVVQDSLRNARLARILLPTSRRNARLQFFEPVLHNDDFLSRRFLAGAH